MCHTSSACGIVQHAKCAHNVTCVAKNHDARNVATSIDGGTMTASMTWISPFDASISVVTTFAEFTLTQAMCCCTLATAI